MQPFCLVLVYFRATLRALVAYHLKRGGMPLHHPIRVNCENDTTTEYPGGSSWHMDYGVTVGRLCVHNLT